MTGVSLRAGSVSFMIGQDDWKKGRNRSKGEGFRMFCMTDKNVDALAKAIAAAGRQARLGPARPAVGRARHLPDGSRRLQDHDRRSDSADEGIRADIPRGDRRGGVVMASRRAAGILAWAGAAALFAAATSPRAVAQETAPPAAEVQASLVTVPAEVPADARRYTVLLAGNKAGVLAVWKTPDGARHNFFAFNDRGRGPSITTRVVVDRSGLIDRDRRDGPRLPQGAGRGALPPRGRKATWRTKRRRARSSSRARLSTSPSTPFTGELEAALLAARGGRLPLLPEGEARIERVARSHDRGRRQEAEGHPVRGDRARASRPSPAGSRRTGPSRHRQRLVRHRPRGRGGRLAGPARGAEGPRVGARRRGRQEAPEEARRPAAHRARAALRQRDGDREGRHVRADRRRAHRRRRSGRRPDRRGSEDVIDASGKMLLPGLWDMHVHLGEWDDGVLHLAAGVTTVRDLANDVDHLQGRARSSTPGRSPDRASSWRASSTGAARTRGRRRSSPTRRRRRRPRSTATSRSGTCRSRSTARSSRSSFP